MPPDPLASSTPRATAGSRGVRVFQSLALEAHKFISETWHELCVIGYHDPVPTSRRLPSFMPVVLALACAFALVLASLGASAPAGAKTRDDSPLRGEVTVPLRTVVFSGNRYVADADLGLAQRVPLMIHGNARMFLMLTHEVGEKLTGGPVT